MKTTILNQSKGILLAVIVLLCIPLFCNATCSVKGWVLDEANQPIQYATATLVNPATNQIVAGDMCDVNGEFILENVKPGFYILSVRNVGYENDESRIIVVVEDTEPIYDEIVQLNEKVYELNEVEVISKKYTDKIPVVELS